MGAKDRARVNAKRAAAILAVAGAGLAGGAPAAIAAGHGIQVRVLSTRADLVSGGDALVELGLPAGVGLGDVTVRNGATDITGDFARRENGKVEGLVAGLALGRNTLRATAAGATAGTVTVVNHPNGGPVFSGPQMQPWPCQPTAVDKQCDQPTSYAYQYKSSQTAQFAAYDPANPPSDVATTTTEDGKTVPFIARVETGYADRDQYQIAVLYDPKKPWAPWAPQPAWNGKALVTQGAACGNHHGSVGSANTSDTTPSVMDSEALGMGFAVMAPALDNSAHNCNVALQSESVEMLKEHFVKTYGPLRFTIAEGGSGGALSQLQDANAYPGLYQGLLPSATFPDAWSSAMDSVECPAMETYFEDPTSWAPGVTWTPLQTMAAEGKVSPTICHAWKEIFPFEQSAEPGRASAMDTKFGALDLQNCGLTDDQIWSETKPTGVRCDLADSAVNVFGRRPQDGYANRPYSNVGVQFGLAPLMARNITPAQFVDLNQHIGGRDINFVPTASRTQADPGAMGPVYRSGAVNEANNLDLVAIIDQPAQNTDIHEQYRALILRARLDKAHGNHDNDVIWFGQGASFPDPLAAMNTWLNAIEKDHSGKPLAAKIASDRPASVHDICNVAGQDDLGGAATCRQLAPFGTGTRGPAGMPMTTDILQCHLKPLRRDDYAPIQFSDAQWAQLQKLFPTGVCDYSKPGVGQQPTVAWQTYQTDGGGHVWGGRPLGPAPAGSAPGWTSPSFDEWLQRGSAARAATRRVAKGHAHKQHSRARRR
jgi:hypothetical protein